jgi:hypothetical protein
LIIIELISPLDGHYKMISLLDGDYNRT